MAGRWQHQLYCLIAISHRHEFPATYCHNKSAVSLLCTGEHFIRNTLLIQGRALFWSQNCLHKKTFNTPWHYQQRGLLTQGRLAPWIQAVYSQSWLYSLRQENRFIRPGYIINHPLSLSTLGSLSHCSLTNPVLGWQEWNLRSSLLLQTIQHKVWGVHEIWWEWWWKPTGGCWGSGGGWRRGWATGSNVGKQGEWWEMSS